MYIYIHIYIYIYVYMYMHVCACVRACVRVCTHTHTHSWAHIHTQGNVLGGLPSVCIVDGKGFPVTNRPHLSVRVELQV